MSIDEVMTIAAEYRDASTFSGQCVARINLRAAIVLHVAEAVAREREECALIADKWATSEQRKFGNGGPAAATRHAITRAAAEIGRQMEESND